MMKKRAYDGIVSKNLEVHQKKQKVHGYDHDRSRSEPQDPGHSSHQDSSYGHHKQLRQGSIQNASREAALAQLTSRVLGEEGKMEKTPQAAEEIDNISALDARQVYRPKQFTSSSSDVPQNRISNKPPDLKPNQTTLPKLPPVLDRSLADLPFTHRGTVNAEDHANASYERLEFLGDAYIELIATRLIFPRFPKLSAGRLSQIRQSLVQNETLALYSLAYGFDERAQLPSSYKGQDHYRKLWVKALGDIFEAYVAAVILSDPVNGFTIAEKWLTELWSPKLLGESDTLPMNVDAKQDLSRKVVSKGIRIDYRDVNSHETINVKGKISYHIAVYLTGWGWENQYLGSGKGCNKKEAGARAAMEALSNPLTAQIAAVKRDHDAKIKLEKQQQSDGTGTSEHG